MMHTEMYCTTLDSLDRPKAIRAIHELYLQLHALNENVDVEHYDQGPALDALAACLMDAGHPGFAERAGWPHTKV